MAVVTIPFNDPWVVARWAFRMLAERTAVRVSEHDKATLDQAIALDGLHFDLLEPDQARRLALAMQLASDELRFELLTVDQPDPRDGEFAEALAVLEMRLHDVRE